MEKGFTNERNITLKEKGFRKIITSVCLLVLLHPAFSQKEANQKLFLVCGDSKVLLVDYNKSRDSIPEIVWTWDAHQAQDLPEDYRLKKFNSVDDCKSIRDGKEILISSSAGAIAILQRANGKVLFLASVPNAHSIELLPGNRLAAAASTATEGNRIMLFDIRDLEKPLFSDSLYSAHGVVWDQKRKSLFALGYDVLREYKVLKNDKLQLKNKWTIPGIGGHDLQPSPDGESLFVTEHGGSWVFDLDSYQFSKIEGFPDAHNIKSLGQNHSGQYIFTIPEESWWTHHVLFSSPRRSFAFPAMKVYKARWWKVK